MGNVLSKFGSFAKSATTGNQSVTGVGFQPKVVFFFSTSKTSSGSAANIDASFGVATDGDSAGFGDSAMYYASNNVSTTVNNAGIADVRMHMRGDNTGNLTVQGAFASMDADGFTINWPQNNGQTELICYLALGGSGITKTLTGTVNVGTAVGNMNVNGVGFRPDLVMNFTPSSQNVGNTVGLKDLWGGFGVTSVPTSEQAYMAHFFAHNTSAATASAAGVLKTDKSFGQITTTQRIEGEITSFNANGYSMYWDTHDGFDALHEIVCLAGGKYKVGNFLQPVTTGDQKITTGFRPSSVLLFSANTTASTITNPLKFSIGAGSSTTDRGSMWFGAAHQNTPTKADHNIDTTKIIKMMTATGNGSPTTQAAADLASLNSDGFTLNWTAADASQRVIAYLAIGTKSVGDFAVRANNSTGFSITSDANTPPTVTPDTPDVSTFNTATPALQFTGTDAQSDAVEYNVQIHTSNTFGVNTNQAISSYDSVNKNGSANLYGNGAAGQSFTATAGTLTGVKFQLKKIGSPTGNAIAKLYAHSGTYGTSSVPTGDALAISDVLDVSTLPTGSYQLTTIAFTGDDQFTLVNGTHYVVTLEYSGGDVSNAVTVCFDDASPTATGNMCYTSSGWTANAAWDILFEIVGTTTSAPLISKFSATDPGFSAGHPFTSGAQVTYTVQAGDSLAGGTYYWRVCATDPLGTNTYGAWTTVRTFTINSYVPRESFFYFH